MTTERHFPPDEVVEPDDVHDWLVAQAAAIRAEARRYPCYCLPGPARCDTLGEHCARAAALDPAGADSGEGR